MRGRVRHRLIALIVLLAGTTLANAGCLDPTHLAHSTVSIMRHYDQAERSAHNNLVGVRGTGWFLSPTTIVTAEHVTAAMNLSRQDWKQLEIGDGGDTQFIEARIRGIAGSQAEKLAVVELQIAPSHARSFEIRGGRLVPEEHVMTLAYASGRPHFVSGRFVQFGDEGKLAGMALLELYEGENRLVVDHGSSGAPVIDCDGRVVAVVTNVFTASLTWGYREIKVSTAWGMPNVVSVPVEPLQDYAD
jgi:Trypsin-like peptidase domain